LSIREFCRQHPISTSTLACYLRRHASKHPSAATSASVADHAHRKPSFLSVEVVSDRPPTSSSAARSALVIELARGIRIAVECGFDEVTLRRLMAVLGQE
jgi:hypothetical protein